MTILIVFSFCVLVFAVVFRRELWGGLVAGARRQVRRHAGMILGVIVVGGFILAFQAGIQPAQELTGQLLALGVLFFAIRLAVRGLRKNWP